MNNRNEINFIRNFFKEYIFGFIFNDIERSIKAKTNFLTTLGLLCYTEFLGSLIRGKRSPNRANFNEFLYRMGPGYELFDQQCNDKFGKDVYSIYRCGMVHEYFVKETFVIARDSKNNSGSSALGLGWTSNKIGFATRNYFEDFKNTVNAYYQELLKDSDKNLIDNFLKVAKGRRINTSINSAQVEK